ncbi:tetratricopeptide repeat protein [Halopseudomonas pelagia]|uniref:tetratricopeptide repeat protein n=1 Tax=Halopseudomonas pelagia TaxID=553151 RepID=UPI0030DD24BB|tara:strand:- start:553 stop:1632 length:1080 start_codon:yes stop_codon:yes gene_type:complete
MRILVVLLMLCAAAVQAQSINPAAFRALNEAQQAQQRGDYAAAGKRLQQALEQASTGSVEQALVEQRLGYLAIARDRNAEAIDWLRKALSRDQLEAEAASQDRRNLAQLLASEGQAREAVTLLETELAAGALPRENRRLLVQLYNQLEQYSKALPLAEQVVREEPGVDAVWYQLLVGMNYRLQRYQAAERWLKVLLKREPGNAEYWRQLAGVQSLDKRQRAAAGTLRLAYEGGIRFAVQDLDNLVALQVNAGAPWQAARLLEALLQRQLLQANAVRQERLAQLWQQARDHDRAKSAWTALALSSGRADHWLRVAAIQLNQGEWDELLSSLERARPAASAEQRRTLNQWAAYARQAQQEG